MTIDDNTANHSRWPTACISDRGGRDENQDACAHRNDPGDGVWLLADGLGGHHGGATAAHLAVDTAVGALAAAGEFAPETLKQALATAHQALLDRQDSDPDLARMRTTLVALWRRGDQVLWGYTGDSRLYLFRDGRVLLQTKDHSVPQMLADSGEIGADEVRGHEDRNRLLRALGTPGPLRATLLKAPRRVQSGDALLLCSDGFWEPLPEADMEAALADADEPAHWLAALERLLRERVHGDYDNYSALAVRVP